MHNTNSDLFAVIAVALGRIPYKDLAPLTDRSHMKREELREELARYLEESLLPHFEVKRLARKLWRPSVQRECRGKTC